MLIDQINEGGDSSEAEEEKKFVKGADRFGGKALKVPTIEVKRHDDAELKKAAQKLQG